MRLAFIFALLATSAGADTQAAPDCSRYSLEGVRLGMTMEEARDALPGRALKAVKCKGCPDGIYEAEPMKRTKGQVYTSVAIGTEGGRVTSVSVDYLDGKLSHALTVQPKAAEAAFLARFGEPDERERIPVSSIVGSNMIWRSHECDVRVVFSSGKIFVPGGMDGGAPLLTAVLLRDSLVAAAQAAESDKVKF